jgi:primosomal protein N'
MYIVEVTPFSKSMRSNSLSYFSSTKVAPGSIVTVPLRSKDIKGLVIGVKSAKESKSELRTSDFALKKIKGVSKKVLFSKEFTEAAKEVAEYFATSTGSIIQSLIPSNIIDDILKLQKTSGVKSVQEEVENPKYILQSSDHDRYSEYRSIIRGQFAQNKSVLFCVPTIEDGNLAEKELSRGIEKHTFILNSRLSKTKIISNWNEIINRKKPSLVIVTSGFVGIPINDIGIIIVEKENSNAYRTNRRPYFDLRFFFEQYASAMGATFLLGDLMLRAETLWRYDQHEFIEHDDNS